MADYAAQIATANRLISEKGMAMTFLSVTEYGKIDPDTGKRPVTVTETPFYGVRTQPSTVEVQRGQFQDVAFVILAAGDAIEAADTTDVIQFNGRDYDIAEIQRVCPAEQVILYKFGVKDAGKAGSSTRLIGAG